MNILTFVPGQYFRINKFSGLLNRQLVLTWKSVPTLFVRISKISGLSEPGLTNHQCIFKILWMAQFPWGTNFRGFRGGSDPRILLPTN